jgi:hypothetical protein
MSEMSKENSLGLTLVGALLDFRNRHHPNGSFSLDITSPS